MDNIGQMYMDGQTLMFSPKQWGK